MIVELSASMMCADFSNLEREVRSLEEGGIDSFHVDIMDGRFVDNFGMGYQDMKYIRSATKKPVELHLMVKEPLQYFTILNYINPDTIYVHPESDLDPATTLEKIEKMGSIPGIAINPGTSIPQIEELLNVAKKVLVLAVNPGHAGRKYAEYVGDKVKRLSLMRAKMDFEIIWDGAASMKIIQEFGNIVDGFVLGTASLFGRERSYHDIIENIRNMQFEAEYFEKTIGEIRL